jgi:hypothetical protein
VEAVPVVDRLFSRSVIFCVAVKAGRAGDVGNEVTQRRAGHSRKVLLVWRQVVDARAGMPIASICSYQSTRLLKLLGSATLALTGIAPEDGTDPQRAEELRGNRAGMAMSRTSDHTAPGAAATMATFDRRAVCASHDFRVRSCRETAAGEDCRADSTRSWSSPHTCCSGS